MNAVTHEVLKWWLVIKYRNLVDRNVLTEKEAVWLALREYQEARDASPL